MILYERHTKVSKLTVVISFLFLIKKKRKNIKYEITALKKYII